jgi:uncharacterized protein (TIGR03437 family)
MAPVTRVRAGTDFSCTGLPMSLNGFSATVDGEPAYWHYVSQKQIDVLTPADTTTGPVNAVVTSNALISPTASAAMGESSAFFFQ